MDGLRREADGVLVVDAGDSLDGGTVPAAQRPMRGRFLLEAYAALGMDAMGVGERERSSGVDLGRIRTRALVTRGGIPIGVFALDLDQTNDPAAALRASAAALRRKGARLVVALVHGGMPRAREIFRSSAPGVDVAVVSHTGAGTTLVDRAGATWLVEAFPQAKQVGVLDLHILDDRLSFQDFGLRGQLETTLFDQEQELLDLDARAAGATAERLRAFYENRKKQVEGLMADERRQLQVLPTTLDKSWLENRQVPLGPELGDQPAMARLVAGYKAEVAKLPAVPAAQAAPSSLGYSGGDACRGCHAAAFALWKTTRHAHAFATLVGKHQERDASCVGCHVTAGLTGLPDVQCEACHGPGGRHLVQPHLPGLVQRSPSETQCRSCHTPKQTTEWDFASFRAAVLGPGHGAPERAAR